MMAHGRVSEYLDDALDIDDEAAFLDHLSVCAECQAELHAEVQLREREDALREHETSPRCAAGTAGREFHGRTGEYLDDMLHIDGEAAFLDHLPVCAECQAELHADVQLRELEDAVREAVLAATRVKPAEHNEVGTSRSVPRRRDGRAWRRAVATAIAAAAVLALLITQPVPPEVRKPVAFGLQSHRTIEIRLSHHSASKYRPYGIMRSGAIPGEPIAPAVIADLDRAGDCHGVATAYVLSGEWIRADEHYRRCTASPDLDADRAGLAVLRGDLDAALELADRALDTAPDHTVALWNRALALRALGLELSAATAFDRVAALEQDTGWAQEARALNRATLAEIERMHTAYSDVERVGLEMVRGGPPIPVALARQVPARSRVMLQDAIRTATTADRLDELAPLAAALERGVGTGLARYLKQARAALSPERATASAGYQAIVARSNAIDDHAWKSWLAVATRARADDLILGARILTGRLDGAVSAEQLAAATGDPWFERAVELARVRAALGAGRIEEGAARLTALQAHCPPGTVSYRCLDLAVEMSRLALSRHQPPEAKRHALAAIAMARQLGEWPQRSQALTIAGDAERFGGNFVAARAYYEESAHSRDACGKRNAAFTMAEMLFQDHQIARAYALAAAAPTCDVPPSVVELKTLVRLVRAGHAVLDRAAMAAAMERARGAPESANDDAYLDYLTAWAVLDDDYRARERLSHAAERALGSEGAMREKTLLEINSALFADAGRRTAWNEALTVIARAHGVPPPPRCALAFAADDFRFAVIAVGPDGALHGRYEPDLVRLAEWMTPESIRRYLADCGDVAVLALSPWLGIGPVLEAQTPWHYVLGPTIPPTPGRRRHVVIANPITPSSAGLAPLAPRTWPGSGGPDELITGAAATPERTLDAILDATLIEIHSHTTWLDRLDAPVLALSPGSEGWSLGAAKIRTIRLTNAPVVVLADCAGGAAARYEHEAWGLPLAFRTAGARAVIASLSVIPDRDATAFVDALVAELARGTAPAAAVARLRAEKMRGDPTSWMRNVVVFQ